jgi:hypothetical protein
MGYIPKIIKGKMNFNNITTAEILKSCSCESEVAAVKKFYEKLDGTILHLSLWDYDNHDCYHLSSWDKEVDNIVMEAIFIIELEFGVYSDFEEFKNDWKNGEYDPGCSIIFPLSCAEELEIICEESDELSESEKLELINSMEIIDSSISGGEIEYILVKNNDVNRGILHKLGISDKEIEEKCCPEDGAFDITSIGGRYANYFNKSKKFFNKK